MAEISPNELKFRCEQVEGTRGHTRTQGALESDGTSSRTKQRGATVPSLPREQQQAAQGTHSSSPLPPSPLRPRSPTGQAAAVVHHDTQPDGRSVGLQGEPDEERERVARASARRACCGAAQQQQQQQRSAACASSRAVILFLCYWPFPILLPADRHQLWPHLAPSQQVKTTTPKKYVVRPSAVSGVVVCKQQSKAGSGRHRRQQAAAGRGGAEEASVWPALPRAVPTHDWSGRHRSSSGNGSSATGTVRAQTATATAAAAAQPKQQQRRRQRRRQRRQHQHQQPQRSSRGPLAKARPPLTTLAHDTQHRNNTRRPRQGVVEPRATANVQVIMQAQKEYPADMAACKDKFLVQTEALRAGEEIGPDTFKRGDVSAPTFGWLAAGGARLPACPPLDALDGVGLGRLGARARGRRRRLLGGWARPERSTARSTTLHSITYPTLRLHFHHPLSSPLSTARAMQCNCIHITGHQAARRARGPAGAALAGARGQRDRGGVGAHGGDRAG